MGHCLVSKTKAITLLGFKGKISSARLSLYSLKKLTALNINYTSIIIKQEAAILIFKLQSTEAAV